MAFEYTAAYFIRKIQLIERAIIGTSNAMSTLTEQRQIDAHQGQIISYEKSLVDADKEFTAFKLIPCDCSMCEIRAGRCHSATKRLSKNCLKIYVSYNQNTKTKASN